MKFTDLIPNVADFLSLGPEELAAYLIEYLNSLSEDEKERISQYEFISFRTVSDYPGTRRKESVRALSEAWSVLVQEGLVAPKPHEEDPMHVGYFITRRGKTLRNAEDFISFRHSELFPKNSIHPELLKETYPSFLRGEYETAIFQAFKTVEVRVRNSCPPAYENLLGTDLMHKAFHAENGPLTNKAEPIAERQALQALLAGAIGRFKNPSSHRHVPIKSPTETIEVLQFASQLLRVIDDRLQGPR